MAPRIKMQMDPATRKALRTMQHLLTVGELGYSAGLAADLIAEEARRLAPGKTGTLKRGIVARINKVSAYFAGQGSAYVGVDYHIAPHAHLVEYGARGGQMPAHPFIRPAIANKQHEAAQKIDADLTRRIEKKMRGA
ncbi:MAG: HK97-gp10 family putative phage morphogenesis protein [Thermodesulfobacteriota bacterium]